MRGILELRPDFLMKPSNMLLASGKKDKRNFIMFFGNEPSDIEKLYKSNMFYLKNYKQYYFPHKYNIVNFNNLKKPIITTSTEITSRAKSLYSFSSVKTSLPLNDDNTILDMTEIYTGFRQHFKARFKPKLKQFVRMIAEQTIDNENILENFDNFFVMVPMDFLIPSLEYKQGAISKMLDVSKLNALGASFSYEKSFMYVLHSFFPNQISGSGEEFDRVYDTTPADQLNKRFENKEKRIIYVFYSLNKGFMFYMYKPTTTTKGRVANFLKIIMKYNHNELSFTSDERNILQTEVIEFKNDIDEQPSSTESKLIDAGILPDYYNPDYTAKKKDNLKLRYIGTAQYSTKVAAYKVSQFIDSISSFNASGIDEEDVDAIAKEISTIENNTNKTEEEVTSAIDNNEKLKEMIANITQRRMVGEFTQVETKILQNAKDKFKSVKLTLGNQVKNKTYSEIMKAYEDKRIDIAPMDVGQLLHKELAVSSLKDFDKSYNEKLFNADIVRMFNAFEDDPENPIIVTDIKVEDTSNELNYKHTYKVEYKNKNNKTLNITVDIPAFFDEHYLLLNGTKKIVGKQIASLPFTKTDMHQVFIVSSAKKFNVGIKGNKINPIIENLIKHLDKYKLTLEKQNIVIKNGNNTRANKLFLSNIEFNYLSERFFRIHIKDYRIVFNRKSLQSELLQQNLILPKTLDTTHFPIGYNPVTKETLLIKYATNEVVSYNSSKQFVIKGQSLSSYLIDAVDAASPGFLDDAMSYSLASSYMYSVIEILSKKIPLIVVLSAQTSFFDILNKANIVYEVSDKRKTFKDPKDKMKYRYIQFKDFFLYYESNMNADMLLNGMSEMSTSQYTMADIESQEILLDYYRYKFNSVNFVKAVRRMLNRTMDPLTVEVLTDYGFPTNIIDILLLANSFVSNSEYKVKNHTTNYRIRPAMETIVVALYNVLQQHFNEYLSSTKQQFSVPRDAVIKYVLDAKNVENFSVLNPTYEVQSTGKANYRGPMGINSEDAFTTAMRIDNDSMRGLFGSYNIENSNIGTIKFLTFNPKLSSARGYIDHSKTIEDMNAIDMFSYAELNNPFSNTRSDPNRQSMVIKQTEHIIPTFNTTPPMVGTGIENVFMNFIGTDFIFIAKEDGVVSKIDEKSKIIVVKYSNGFEDVIDISDRTDKNSQSGFFITNTLSHNLKVGQKFKKGDTLARNNDYFKETKNNGVQYAYGTLAKVAITMMDNTLEDSSLVTREFLKGMSSNVTMEETVEVDTNTNILQYIRIGDTIKVGDPLMTLERVFRDSTGVNLLDRLPGELTDDISNISKDIISSKYDGVITDIRVYFNEDLEKFTKYTQKFINEYIETNKRKKAIIDGVKLKGKANVIVPRLTKLDQSKITTKEMSGLLVKIYIKHLDEFKIGDKIAFQTAIKSIVSEIIDEGEEPYSEFRPDEKIDAIFSPLSVVSRMTTDLFNLGYIQKVLLETKRQIKDIWEEK